MSQQSKSLSQADVELTERDLSGVRQVGRSNVVQSPLAKQVAAHLEVRADRPDARLQAMVAESRAKLDEIEDQREKLEAYRDVELKNATDLIATTRDKIHDSINDYEERVRQLRQDMLNIESGGRAKLSAINTNINVQVEALDTMETLHRAVVESAPKKPRRKKADDDGGIAF